MERRKLYLSGREILDSFLFRIYTLVYLAIPSSSSKKIMSFELLLTDITFILEYLEAIC
jgi:hypothetical protein